MNENIIKTKKGVYGRVNITLPLTIKNPIMDLQKKLGLRKAEYLRMVMVSGFQKMSDEFEIRNSDQSRIDGFAQAPARTEEDGQLAQNNNPPLLIGGWSFRK